MSSLNLRIPKEVKDLIEKQAKNKNKNISDYIRDLIYEKIEDIEDLRDIKEYEKNKDKEEYISHEKFWESLGI